MRLRRRALFVAFIVAITSLRAYAQSSKDGSFRGKTFTDSYFKIAFDLPPFLNPQPVNSLSIHASETLDAWPMAVGREGSESYGIVVISQRLKPGKFSSSQDYLQIVRNSRSQGDVIAGSGHKLNAYGLTFDWLDWKAGHEYNSAVITQRGDYLIVARCNSKSDEELKLMKNALVGMRITSR
jgi:hypothetical protein